MAALSHQWCKRSRCGKENGGAGGDEKLTIKLSL